MSLPPVINMKPLLKEMPSEELFELAELMEGLQSSTAWGRLQRIADDAKEKARQAVEMGPVREQGDYARWMGFINGFSVQPTIIRQIIQGASERRLELEREAAAERERTEAAAASVE